MDKCFTICNCTQVRTCGRKEAVKEPVREDKYSAEITKTIIEKYEEFYGTQFPLPKIGTVYFYILLA